MATNYTFAVTLLDASANPNVLGTWQSGTVTLEISPANTVTGSLTIPGFYKDVIPFRGTVVQPSTASGTTVTAQGESVEASITLSINVAGDGFLYNGSYLGGLLSILDNAAQETYLYVVQGLSPQSPDVVSRQKTDEGDKRKPRVPESPGQS